MRSILAVLAVALTACATPRVPFEDLPLDDAIVSADVVFFGEAHDDAAQHAYQAELAARMAEASRADGRPFLVGMEMFQRPFQAPLDDYAAGRVDEKEMLRRTEYFTRWSFDSGFYAPIWRAARDAGGRIVALNADAAISRKVGREGLASLTAEERAGIAADIDLADTAHRERIVGLFNAGAHRMPEDRLQKMYEAMTLWDETMAESAARAFTEAGARPRMLVVAGSGHVGGWTGIPDRMARRVPGLSRVVILAGEPADPPRDAGQYVVPIERREAPPAPKIGFAFTPAAGGGLSITAVTEGGAAANAGIAVGDVVLSVGGEPMADMTDLRWFLERRRVGDVVAVTFRRGAATQTVDATLAPAPAPALGPAK